MIILLFLALSTPDTELVLTQEASEQVGTELQELYEQGKYFAVIEQAEEALKDTGLTIQDKVGIHTVLAFCYVVLDKDNLAKLEFLEALALNPELELDPILTSPKIIKVFQDAKSTFRFFPAEKKVALQTNKDFKVFIIPGLWDIRCGNKKRGYFLLGWSSASIISVGISHCLYSKYHQEYLDARDETTIEDKYQAYSFWYQSRVYSLGWCGITYLLNLFLLALSH